MIFIIYNNVSRLFYTAPDISVNIFIVPKPADVYYPMQKCHNNC